MTQAQAALLAALLLFGIGGFHTALALGAPWGAFAWGGENEGQLPPRLRRGSGLLAPVIVAMGVVLLLRGGWVLPDEAPQMLLPVWAVLLFLIIQLFGALRSNSRREQRVMTPVYLAAAALTAFVGFGTSL
ncbi:MAG: hypothetical protein P4M09_13925 [Devosia sp.]|nr:hypothetical protein [Devosia sp.]